VVLSKLKDDIGGKAYQGSELHNFRDSIKTCQVQALADLKSQMHSQLKWSDVNFASKLKQVSVVP